MKRIGNLYERFCSWENLSLAYKKALSGARKNKDTQQWYYHYEQKISELRESLLDCSYEPAAYRYFEIKDPKHRTISVAPFRDRIVHHALVNILEPIYEARFIHDSYATRKEKGTHKAIDRAQFFLRQNAWFFKTDIEKYFDNIDQAILMKLIESKIKDKKLLFLTQQIIANGGSNGKGLPIGNLTSQFFANVYLHPLDSYIKESLQIKSYIRYMDDFVIFSDDKQKLKNHRKEIAQFLDRQLHLTLKPKATFFNHANNGLSFLGTRIFRSTVRIKRENLKRIIRGMKQRLYLFQNHKITLQSFLDSLNSRWAHLSKNNTFKLRQKILDLLIIDYQ